MYQVFTGSSVDGHLGYLHILAIVNSAAVNTGVCVSFRITVLFFFSSDIYPGAGFLDHMVLLLPQYLKLKTRKQSSGVLPMDMPTISFF